MSAENIRAVLLRAVRDEDFYARFRESPDAALEEYDLTPMERSLLLKGDRSLTAFLTPLATVDPDDAAVTITVTITGMHDWFNVARVRPIEELPVEVFAEATGLARRVLGQEGADRVATLITLLQVLDGRQEEQS